MSLQEKSRQNLHVSQKQTLTKQPLHVVTFYVMRLPIAPAAVQTPADTTDSTTMCTANLRLLSGPSSRFNITEKPQHLLTWTLPSFNSH